MLASRHRRVLGEPYPTSEAEDEEPSDDGEDEAAGAWKDALQEGATFQTDDGEALKAIKLLSDAGAFGIVWLARELKAGGRYVAVKVQNPKHTAAGEEELAVLRAINAQQCESGGEGVVKSLGSGYIKLPASNNSNNEEEEEEEEEGDRGEGDGVRCLFTVLELCGPDLSDLISNVYLWRKTLPGVVLRKLAADSVAGLADMHSLGFIHTDIRPENIMLKGAKVWWERTLDEEEEGDEDGSGADARRRMVDVDGGAPLDPFCATLIDFGNAVACEGGLTGRLRMDPEQQIQTRPYRAPEAICHCDVGPPADVWSLGCVVWELATAQPLFGEEAGLPQRGSGAPGAGVNRDRAHLKLIADLVGPFTVTGGGRCEHFFDEDGQLLAAEKDFDDDDDDDDNDDDDASDGPPPAAVESSQLKAAEGGGGGEGVGDDGFSPGTRKIINAEHLIAARLESILGLRKGDDAECGSNSDNDDDDTGEDTAVDPQELLKLADFFAKALHPDPERRATAAQLMHHPWLLDPLWTQLEGPWEKYMKEAAEVVEDEDDICCLRAQLEEQLQKRAKGH